MAMLEGEEELSLSLLNKSTIAWIEQEYHQKLHSEIKKVLFSNEIKDKLFSLTTEPIGSSPEDFGDFIKSESNKWMKLIKDKNIKPE